MSVTESVPRGSGPPLASGSPTQPHYRPEVQGLRALAVLMVVTYHVWFGRVSGGVDIFLLISAFLLTLSFLRKGDSGRALNLGKYWLHLFKRLLPAVVVVLLSTLAATYFLVPRSRWPDILEQSWASLFYVQNWVLAANSVDYYAADDSTASPLQHFWSLSVQGQVFVLWPLLFALALLVARSTKIRYRLVVLILFGALFCVSLTFSVYETYTNQAFAYFDTRARLWEFALGTLLALALPYLRLPRRVRIPAGWIGLAAMLSGGFLLDVERQFPGFVALWPLLSAVLVIAAGQTDSRFGADRFLSWKPLVRMGDMSYALYLWHWPVLVIFLIATGGTRADLPSGAGIIAASLVLAYLTTRFIERPIRSWHWLEQRQRRSAGAIVVCLALAAGPVVVWQGALQRDSDRLAAQTDADNPGAKVLMDGFRGDPQPTADVIPAAAEIQLDWAELEGNCEDLDVPSPAEDLGGGCSDNLMEDPSRTIVVVGDSHAQQWLGAVGPMAEREGWKVIALLLGGCTYGAGPDAGRSSECVDFNEGVTSYIKELAPDAVFVVATRAHPDTPQDTVVPGLAERASELMASGIDVVGVRDNPRFSSSLMACVESQGADDPECNPAQSSVITTTPPFEELQEEAPGMGLMDMTDLLCAEGVCPPIIGNIHTYLDDNHLSATYAESMQPEFGERFAAAAGW